METVEQTIRTGALLTAKPSTTTATEEVLPSETGNVSSMTGRASSSIDNDTIMMMNTSLDELAAESSRFDSSSNSYEISGGTPESAETLTDSSLSGQNDHLSLPRDEERSSSDEIMMMALKSEILEFLPTAKHEADHQSKDDIVESEISSTSIEMDSTENRSWTMNESSGSSHEFREIRPRKSSVVPFVPASECVPFRVPPKDGETRSRWKCPVCTPERTFPSPKAAESHVHAHTGNRPYSCDQCGRTFVSMSNVATHQSIVHRLKTFDLRGNQPKQAKEFPCSFCDKRFNYKSVWKSHERSIHLGGGTRVPCNQCPPGESKFFSALSSLQTHIRRFHSSNGDRSGPPPLMCPDCGKGFWYKQDLKRHSMIHSDTKPFACHLCPKSFRDPTTLRNHQIVHSGVKPHQCFFCDQRFSRPHHLRRHQMSAHPSAVWQDNSFK